MSKSDKERETVKQALDYDWPEIQKRLIAEGNEKEGEKSFSFDSWWLDEFDRKDVIRQLPGVAIMNTAHWHLDSACATFLEAYGIRDGRDCDDCFTADDILAHTQLFPKGQFVAIRISGPGAGHAVAMAVTMRTSRPPSAPILPWMEAIGDLRLRNHEPDGEWLYGVEMAVRPSYRRHGIGTGLYEARFNLVRQLNLRGWYAVGMLMGYKNYAVDMDVIEYGEKVIAREIKDPTVTMQMNRGFRAEQVMTDYCEEPAAADAGVLIVWENPEYESD